MALVILIIITTIIDSYNHCTSSSKSVTNNCSSFILTSSNFGSLVTSSIPQDFKNSFVTLYAAGLPGKLSLATSSTNPHSNNLLTAKSLFTPLILSISDFVIFGLYAIILKVSRAEVDKFCLFVFSTNLFTYL